MKRYANLNEQVSRMKQLSLITEIGEQPVGQQPTAQSGQLPAQNVQQQTNQENPVQDAQVDTELETAIKMAIQSLPTEMPAITREVVKNQNTPVPAPVPVGEEQLHEFGTEAIGLGISIFLTAPKLTEMLGQAVKQFGISTDIKLIRNIGNKLAVLGKNWHHLYINMIEKAIVPFTKGLDEQNRKIWAERILISMIVGAGVTSALGAIHAAEQGELGMSALESGLGGVKATEIANSLKSVLPKLVSTIGKEVT